jgi:hypothetical protein
MPKTKEQIKALQSELEQLFERHRLTDFAWHEGRELTPEQIAKGGENTCFTMGFDGDVYYVFWPLPDIGEKHIRWNNARRKEFDRIVKRHGFWTEFDDYYRLCFMSLEASARKQKRPA